MNQFHTDLFQKYVDFLELRDLSDGTIKTYSSCCTKFLEWVETGLPGKTVEDVSWEEIRAYQWFLKKNNNLSGSTINLHTAQLRDFWRCILHRDRDNKQVAHIREDEYLPAVPTRTQVDAIIDSFENKKHKAEIGLLYSSGLRISEACALHCRDISMTDHYVFIAKSKNRSERRAILSDKELVILTDYIRTDYRSAKKDDWLFPGQKNGTHTSDETLRKALKDHLIDIGMGELGFTPHSFRHAFALHLYEAGYDLLAIKDALGHKSVFSTTRYLKMGQSSARKVISPYDL